MDINEQDSNIDFTLTSSNFEFKEIFVKPLPTVELYTGNNSNMVYSSEEQYTNFTNYELPIDMQFNEGHILAIVVYSVLFIFSAIGNITVLTTIIRLRMRQGRMTRVNLLLAHLATADLLVTFLMMPMEIAWHATVAWLAGDFLCRFLSFTRIFGLYLSGFLLMCISMDRYYAVAMIFHVESHPTFTWYQQCVTFNSFPSPYYELAYNFFGFSFLYAIPLITIIMFYLRILWEICRINSQRRGDDEQLRRSTIGAFGRAKVRTLKMTVVIVATYFLLWLPYNVMCLWYWLDSHSASQVDQRVQKGLFLFACTNSCLNPLIYGLFHFQRRSQTTGTGATGGVSVSSLQQQRSHRVGEGSGSSGRPTSSMAVSSF